MLFKLCGCALLLLAGLSLAASKAFAAKLRLAVLDAWIALLLYVRTQIDCYLLPLEEILRTADPQMFPPSIGASPVDGLPLLLAKTRQHLSREGERILSACVAELGSSYREEQLKRCDHYLQRLYREREQVSLELPSRVKLGVTLSLCASLGAVILLW